jgi:NAD(P)-dependent dehydrogenase (short-subunit alcohol dehydrogenase family)
MQELTSRVAVIAGAAGGIGLGTARAFAAAAMRLVLADDAVRTDQLYVFSHPNRVAEAEQLFARILAG